ncbi:MAG: S1 RNA-binding domain-containing protein [Candidatus Margulisbacteria bacterium]|nr:S1 RNA-binding domain-containing protein [Candidatus Margulisiibacteriota bacterium]
MIDNFEATKLGDTENELFQTSIPVEENFTVNLSLKGTTIGSESEFEQSLKQNLNKEELKPVEKEESTATAIAEPVTKKEEKAPAPKEEDSEEKMYGMTIKDHVQGDIIMANILTIEKTGVFVDIQFKCEGFVSNEELNMASEEREQLKVGDILRLMLVQLETKEGYSLLSKKKADWEMAWDDALESSQKGDIVYADIISAVKGGLVANYKGLKGFIPASLVTRAKDEPLKNFVNKKIKAQLIEVDQKRKKIILSNKFSDKTKVDPIDTKLLESIEVGQVLKGKVTSIKNFGAFVNIDGVEGLIHISEVSWDRIDKVEDVLTVGEEIEVFVLGVDRDEQKVSLGLKQLSTDPWETVAETYPIGEIITGTINRLATYGAFVKLGKGLEGLIHISELSHEHVKNVEDVVAVGQEVTVKVLRIIPEQQKIGLSLKQTQEKAPETEEIAEPVTETAEEVTANTEE